MLEPPLVSTMQEKQKTKEKINEMLSRRIKTKQLDHTVAGFISNSFVNKSKPKSLNGTPPEKDTFGNFSLSIFLWENIQRIEIKISFSLRNTGKSRSSTYFAGNRCQLI